MNKRYLVITVVFLVVVGLCVAGLVYRNTQQQKATIVEIAKMPVTFEEGKHYHRISPEITANKNIQDFIAGDSKKIQVVEFFNYGCLWCSRLNPILKTWANKKPVNVIFYSVPIVFNKQWETLAKAYYMVKSLGKSDQLDAAFFDAIHQKHIDLSNEKLLKEFFIKNGVSEKQFTELYQSFAISSEVARGVALANAYHIAQSPVVIVNTSSGSYLLTAKAAGSEQALIPVLNHVISEGAKAGS